VAKATREEWRHCRAGALAPRHGRQSGLESVLAKDTRTSRRRKREHTDCQILPVREGQKIHHQQIVTAELIGFVKEYQESLDLLYVRRSNCIAPDGTLVR
jgi:hypothetical protein